MKDEGWRGLRLNSTDSVQSSHLEVYHLESSNMTEKQYWDEIRKVLSIFDQTVDLQKFYQNANDEEGLQFSKTLPLIEGLGDICYKEHRYDEAYNLHYSKALVTALTLWARFKEKEVFQQNVKRLRWKSARAKYHLTIEKWKSAQGYIDSHLQDILDRGLWICAKNSSEGLLLTGINPSYTGTKEESDMALSFSECTYRYWTPLKKFTKPFIDKEKIAYIDLFPLRVSKQAREFEKYVPLTLKRDLLEVTIQEIERTKPRLIIHTNKTSAFYWGTDPEHLWMGYQLSPVQMPSGLEKKGDLYRIDGVQQSNEVIFPRVKTNLIGTYLLICHYQSGGRSPISTEQKLTEKDVLQLWNVFVEKSDL